LSPGRPRQRLIEMAAKQHHQDRPDGRETKDQDPGRRGGKPEVLEPLTQHGKGQAQQLKKIQSDQPAASARNRKEKGQSQRGEDHGKRHKPFNPIFQNKFVTVFEDLDRGARSPLVNQFRNRVEQNKQQQKDGRDNRRPIGIGLPVITPGLKRFPFSLLKVSIIWVISLPVV